MFQPQVPNKDGNQRQDTRRPAETIQVDQQTRVKLHFLGSAGEVSGSLIMLEVVRPNKTTRVLLEAGLHQENDNINHSRRLPNGLLPKDVDAIVISHAHIDHSGYLPVLVEQGYKGPVYTHAATRDLMRFLLPDSGNLQERAAARENERNGHGRRGKATAAKVYPLYTATQARRCLNHIKTVEYDRTYQITDVVAIRFTDAAHILGAAVVTVVVGKGKNSKTICFTGNVGRNDMPFLRNLTPVLDADYIISESTYGNKLHQKRDRLKMLEGIITDGFNRARHHDPKEGCGVIIIPAFAVGRVQTVLYDLRTLMMQKRIPNLQTFLDSPMAVESTKVHRKYTNLYNQEARQLADCGIDPFRTPRYMECRGWTHSRMLDKPVNEPIIIIGSSGMAAGGRILAHIEKRLHRSENTVVFVGYQGTGALGYTLVNEKPTEVVIHDERVPVKARIAYMSDYSGHADYSEMIGWFKMFRRKPKKLFLVHGDPEALTAFKGHIEESLGWKGVVVIPGPRSCFELN
ncbi:MAG: MBL fold metallo-hydrolase [Candidatus Obscuribacterales bacterium]|nr:MBL fold metallo-hydrolase [Candidatus Obscuribacterales bacterium]